MGAPGKLHESIVDELCEKGCEKKLFKRRLHKTFACGDKHYDQDLWEEIKKYSVGIPDAFKIDEENWTVYVYEVQDTHPLTQERVRSYSQLWFLLDCECWDMKLLTVDRNGGEKEIDLTDVWYENLEKVDI